jgi:hypothetical protein
MKFQLSTALGFGALLFFAVQVHAGCRLPRPDGGENCRPSKESIFGEIERVELPNVFVRNGKTKRPEQISVAKIDAIYSVYGGDRAVEALKPGLQVWIWFKDCKRPKSGPIYAAYFEFFSINPKDRAKLNRNGKIVSVPPG